MSGSNMIHKANKRIVTSTRSKVLLVTIPPTGPGKHCCVVVAVPFSLLLVTSPPEAGGTDRSCDPGNQVGSRGGKEGHKVRTW